MSGIDFGEIFAQAIFTPDDEETIWRLIYVLAAVVHRTGRAGEDALWDCCARDLGVEVHNALRTAGVRQS
jgi:hypothetical protein